MNKENKKIRKLKAKLRLYGFFIILLSLLLIINTILNIKYLNKDFSFFQSDKEYSDKSVFELVDIIYVNITNEEIEFFNSVFKDVKPYYLMNIKKVIVVNNPDEYCGQPCGGYYFPPKKEILLGVYNENEIKRVISHELMHSLIPDSGEDLTNPLENNPLHKIVNELGKLHVAFK